MVPDMVRLIALLVFTLADPAVEDGPPPSTPADQALWRAGRFASESIVVERARAGTLQVKVRSNRLLERLEEAAEKAGPAERKSLTATREKLLAAWQRDYQVLSRQWPVDPTRGCGYPLLTFDSALRAPPGTDPVALATARGELRGCVEKARGAVKELSEKNKALATALEEANRALGSSVTRPPGHEVMESEAEEKAEHEAKPPPKAGG